MMIQLQINHDQATKLAAFIHSLRPDWDKPGILDALAKARHRGTACEVAVAAIRCATSGKARTPAVIGLDGEHWREPERKRTGPVTQINGRCETCGHLHPRAENCPPPPDQDRDNAGIAAARRALAQAKEDR